MFAACATKQRSQHLDAPSAADRAIYRRVVIVSG